MKIVILGAGQVGRTAAYHLSREESNEVTVVDTNEEVLRDLQDRLDIRTVAGNAAYPSVLEAAGCASADIIVALTSSDEVNMMACEVAYTLYRTRTKIARIRSSRIHAPPEAVCRRGACRWTCGSAPSSWSPNTSRSSSSSRARCRCWTSPMAACAWWASARARAACW